jgi:glucose/arabinose dehydrogenase
VEQVEKGWRCRRRRQTEQGRHGEVDGAVPDGFIENNNYVGGPVDVMQLKDGSLLVSDDYNGAVYRITYGKPIAAE